MSESNQDKLKTTYKQIKRLSESTWVNAKSKTEKSFADFKGVVDKTITRFRA